MLTVLRSLHVLIVGSWAGMLAGFNFLGTLGVFAFFGQLDQVATPGLGRWSTETATRVAGDLMASLFPKYFAASFALGILAVVTAVLLARQTGRGWFRAAALGLAVLLLVGNIVGCYLPSTKIRVARYAALDRGDTQEADALKRQFFALHGPSLLLDWGTTALALAGLASVGLVFAPARDGKGHA